MFDSPYDSFPWLREKTLAALTAAAHLADLANEPDTTPWYAKTLHGSAQSLVARLAPVVALLHDAGKDAYDQREWQPIADGGSLALARWCKKWAIASPNVVGELALVEPWDESDRRAKAVGEPLPLRLAEDGNGEGIKLEVYGSLTGRLLHDDLPESSRRLLTFLLHSLWLSPHADAVTVSQRFLPGDAGLDAEATAAAYQDLYERGLLEPVPAVDGDDRRVWRLVVEGFNDSKHRAPFVEARFGFPGARLGGRSSIGNIALIKLPANLAPALAWWGTEEQLQELREHLQRAFGDERIYLEQLRVVGSGNRRKLELRLRQHIDEDPAALRGQLDAWVAVWLRERLGAAPADGAPRA